MKAKELKRILNKDKITKDDWLKHDKKEKQ